MQAVADSIPQLVQGMRSSQGQPEELGAQLALIMASQSFLQVRPSTMTQSATIKLCHQIHSHKDCSFSAYEFVVVVCLSPSLSLEVRW